MHREHFSLPETDHLNTLVSSAYTDFGGVGVVGGLALYAVLLAGIASLVWRQRMGALLYFGSLWYVVSYEGYLLLQPLAWLRFLLLVGVITLAAAGAVDLARGRRTAGPDAGPL